MVAEEATPFHESMLAEGVERVGETRDMECIPHHDDFSIETEFGGPIAKDW